jgi:hypothetical protein
MAGSPMPSRIRWLAIAPFVAVTSSTGQPMQGVAGTAGCSAWGFAVPAVRAAASRIGMFLLFMMKSPFVSLPCSRQVTSS